MSTFKLLSRSYRETVEFGAALAKHLQKGDIVCLFGNLGAGKTTLVKGVAQGLRIAMDRVHSPTFVLLNVYEGKIPVYHFDFYRLETTDEIAAIGYEEFLYGEGISLIEWPEKFGDFIPREYLKVELFHQGGDARRISVSAQGKKYLRVMSELHERKT